DTHSVLPGVCGPLYTLVIALHEAGHLVAALSQGIKVEAWSVGLGPKLLSYRAAPGKGGFLKGKLSGPFSSAENVEGKLSPTDKKRNETGEEKIRKEWRTYSGPSR
ncbi:unnamed protein product, partial [Ectocarpus sp. 12 AP-2014]